MSRNIRIVIPLKTVQAVRRWIHPFALLASVCLFLPIAAYAQSGSLGTYARHYYDLFQLASRPEIQEMLQSAEYGEIKQDYDRISRTHFPGSYFYPDQMSFANSDALFATGDLSAAIGREYKGQCEILCFGSHPSWEIVQARFMELRNLL